MSLVGQIIGMGTGGLSVVYKWAAIGGAVLALCVGSFFYGHHEGALAGKAEIAAYAAKRDQQDIELLGVDLKTNDRIVIEYVDRIKVIHDNQTVDQNNAHNNEADKNTTLSKTWVCIFNSAVNGTDSNACQGAKP